MAFTEADLRARLARFTDASVPDSVWEQQKVKSNRDWSHAKAGAEMRDTGPRDLMRMNFRGLERRWVAFDDRIVDYPRTSVSPKLTQRADNLAIAFANGSLADGPYAVVSRKPMPAAVLSWRTTGSAHFAPLWLKRAFDADWRANLEDGLIGVLASHGINATPTDVFHYVYATLNAPRFRELFNAGLRRGFARVPISKDSETFGALVRLGGELTAVHLLEDPRVAGRAPVMDGDDRAVIDDP